MSRLRRFARALTRNPDEADDLVQNAVERALRNLAAWTPGTRLDSWVFRIAQNLWIDQLRPRTSRGPHADLDAAADETGQKDEDMADRLDIARTISRPPPDQRAAVGLGLVEGWSYQEAAAILETPVGTVMSRLSRARERIKAALDAGGDGS